ncbi:MAG: hypothetical protein GY820_45640 [Gammaproteobacteria bacterium]|nr:hypothetical protein [Gammaproteobacteria bacterium]
MRLFVKYNAKGEILSVSKVEVMPDEMPHPFADDPKAMVAEVTTSAKIKGLDCAEIHDAYAINVETKKLKKLR